MTPGCAAIPVIVTALGKTLPVCAQGEGVTMPTWYFLVNDRSNERTIASTEANSPAEALRCLQSWYEPYSLMWLRNHQESSPEEEGSGDGTCSGRTEVPAVPERAGGG
jgi:hypothetical protein